MVCGDEKPLISVVMPSFMGEGTIARSIQSVVAQSFSDWELIVVIDGSRDASESIANAQAYADPRIRVLTSDNQGGPAVARNRGLGEARGDWVLFLDDDDTISRNFLSRMAAEGLDEIDARVSGFVRLNERDEEIGRSAAPEIDDDPVVCCLEGPPAAIHCFLTRRSSIAAVGGFDPSLRIGEDWDLWLRLAQAGCRFESVPEYLAQYRSEGTSLTADGETMLRSFSRVLEKAVESRADDFNRQRAADHLLASLFWSAGNAIGRGEPAAQLVTMVPRRAEWRFDPLSLAFRFIDGLAVGSRRPWSAQVKYVDRYRERIDELFSALHTRFGDDFESFHILQRIEAELLRAGHYSRPIRLQLAVGVPLLPAQLLRGYHDTPYPDLLLLRIPGLRPTPLFTVMTPMFGPMSGSQLLGQLLRSTWRRLDMRINGSERAFGLAARVRRAWRVGLRLLRLGSSGSQPKQLPTPVARLVAETEARIREAGVVATLPRVPAPRPVPEHPATGASAAEWEAFFAHEDPWDYGNAYEQVKYDRTIELIADKGAQRPRHALEIACAEGRFTAQLAPLCDQITAIDISQTALNRAARRNAGVANITFAQRDVFRDGVDGRYDLITCSEVLYYMEDVAALRRLTQQIAEALQPGGRFVHAHAYQLVDSPDRTAFDWDDSFGAQTIFEAFRDTPGLAHCRTIETDCYRIDLFEKAPAQSPALVETRSLGAPLTPEVESSLVWNGAVQTRSDVAQERSYRVPVLMYHRIASDGPAALAPYRIDADQFERQLRYLRRRGFHSINLDEWDHGARLGGSLKGRPIILSFDDAYVDFAETAWPLLQRYGFGALMFVPTGHIGGSAAWDARAGAPAPIMDWNTLARLAGEGLEIGSHLVSHSVSSMLPAPRLLEEAIESRVMLEALTGRSITSVAPPFGVSDARIEGVMEVAGYRRLFRADGGSAPVVGLDLRLPRIGIYRDMDMAAFADVVGTADEPFECRDEP
ncbi:trifunctional glycosyltransferase/class I SAM-dependent methyltransferase/polysaccharide deacetylase [Sphingomonas panaciterrae]|uniref:trifunctional glycosyltransferase/class I SAM-dependent methyltransferase/polysaccharide deacetylase n=1 Tax=Sphingomonas panaciterrae TaxID=1462999 RepID=UPI002FF07D90